jgi:hypothetical protein
MFLLVHLPVATDHQGDQNFRPRLDVPHVAIGRD